MSGSDFKHEPVILKPYLEMMAWTIESRPRLADLTVGGGGHLRALIQNNPHYEKAYALDQDTQALEAAKENLKGFSNLEFIHSNFRALTSVIKTPLDRITVDLGVSSHQLDTGERGFSFQKEGPLDMRMNTSEGYPASNWLMQCSEKELADVIYQYGEEKRSRWFARKWIEARDKSNIRTTGAFVAAFGFRLDSKDRTGRHPMTRVFQALRMMINDEMGALDDLLKEIPKILAPKGRIAVFTFHSLEDRAVKWGLRGILKPLNKKVIIADEDEQRRNPRSRSAKLRVFEKEDEVRLT